jgi:hypothetical protein
MQVFKETGIRAGLAGKQALVTLKSKITCCRKYNTIVYIKKTQSLVENV